MQVKRHALRVAAMALWFGGQVLGGANAETKKPNGDSSTDLAPLDQSGHAADDGPLAHANTPPIGGATQGGGNNPREMGPVDDARDSKANKK